MPDVSWPNEVIDVTPASETTLETSRGAPPDGASVHSFPLQ
jgi:hypothetical protein